MFWWLIIAVVAYFVLRFVWGLVVAVVDVMNAYKNAPPTLDIDALHQEMQNKTEDDLWKMRNEYHSYLIEAIDTQYYRFFLDIIGEIDKRIYFLRSQKKRTLS